MKIVLTTLAAGPQGIARPGTVLDVSQDQAELTIAQRSARPYDKERDAKAPVGFQKAQDGQ